VPAGDGHARREARLTIPDTLPHTPIICPSCQTARTGVTHNTWDSEGQWRCERCGERWTRSRLATAMEHEAWERLRRGVTD